MSTVPSDPRRAVENALWHALEERRDQVRAAGLPFSGRQQRQLQELYDAKNLIGGLCAAMERYKAGGGDAEKLLAMARVMKRGLETWEQVLIRPGEPWTPYVTPRAKRGCKDAIKDASDCIPVV